MGWTRQDFTDWAIVLFTGVLAGAGVYQFIVLGGQLDDMRKDQRPWVEISFKNGTTQLNAALSYTITIVNKGKTPARAITADMAVDEVKNGEEPRLDYPLPHGRFHTGLAFPNDPIEYPVFKVVPSDDGKSTKNYVLGQPEFDNFQAGKTFFVMYAIVSYSDFFGTKHWTRRCAAWVSQNAQSFSGQKCTNYGDVDTN